MRRREIITAFATLSVIVLGVIIFGLTRKAANVSLDYAPDGAKVVLDTGKVVRSGKFYVQPGRHTLKATLNGFTTATKVFTATASTVQNVTLLLNPDSPEGYDYLKNHPDEELHRERLGGQNFTALGEQVTQRLPLVKELPFIDQLYRIDYGPSKLRPNDPSAVTIYITYSSDQGKQQALQWLTFKGYDPAKLEISYLHD